MSSVTAIRLSGVETIDIEAIATGAVKLTLKIAGQPVVSKLLRPEAASKLGDALADACNALRWPRPPAVQELCRAAAAGGEAQG